MFSREQLELDYHALDEICSYNNLNPFDHLSNGGIQQRFRQKPEYIHAIRDLLGDIGFRRFKVLGAGEWSLVLEGPENQVIRITQENYASDNLARKARVKHPAVLQPIKSIPFPPENPEFTIEILPKVEIKKPSANALARMKEALSAVGYVFGVDDSDVFGNTTSYIHPQTHEELAFLIDPGSLRKNSEENVTPSHKEPYGSYLLRDRSWVQYTLFPQLRSKKLSAVIPANPRYDVDGLSLAELKEVVGDDSILVRLIERDGLYPKQIRSLLREANAMMSVNENLSLADALNALRNNSTNRHEL